MVTKDEIATYFQELNVAASDIVLNKCVQICTKYNIDAEDFCDQWYAYTASHLNGAAPTVEFLEKLEKREFQKNKDQISYKRNVSTPKPAQYKIEEEMETNSMVNSSAATTPKSSQKQSNQTPVQTPKTQNLTVENISYSTSTPSRSQTEKYTQRSDSRSVQCYYGAPTANYKREKDCTVAIENANNKHLPDTNFKYMYEIMGKKAKCLNHNSEWLGHAILDKYGLTLTEGTLKSHLGDMVTYGRIVSDSDGKINAQSILLEGTLETNLGHTVNLNLNKVVKYSLFPGQVAVVQGNNPNSSTFIAENIYTDSQLSFPADIPVANDQLQIVVASGPFTLQGSLMYEPLQDLLKYVCEYKPHVLVIIGPFLDKNHESIHNGGLTQTVDSFFEGLVENIMNSLKDTDIQVIIVSSQNEVHSHPVYPTPAYNVRDKYENLTFFPDPCMISLNGLVIGVTSADILFHISNFEIFQDKKPTGPADRMARLASHLLNQHSFYPLYPPYKGVCIDHELFEQYGLMEVKPHVLVLPSNLRHFVKNIQDCVVINPERLTKGYVAGTFARIEVNPGSSRSVANRIACEIIRV